MRKPTVVMGGILLAPALLLADFSYTETTRITGGMLMQMSKALGGFSKSMRKVGEPTISSVAVQGNRMASVNDQTADIYDLDKETVTHIDFTAKTYSTITFAQMREAMEKAMQRAQSRMKEADNKPKPQSEPTAEVDFKMDIKETGKVQSFSGVNAKEVLMIMTVEGKDKKTGQTGAMDTMSSIWVADSIPGYQELEDFQKKLALKMASALAGSAFQRQGMAMAMDPRFTNSMQKMAKEMEKLKGVHIRQITKMGSNMDPSKASEVTDPSTIPEGPTAGEVAGKAAEKEAGRAAAGQIGSRLGIPGGLGGLGGFGRRKPKKEEPPAQTPDQSQQQAQGQQGVLMEMVMELGDFSTGPVNASKFEVPGGFSQIEHPMLKGLR